MSLRLQLIPLSFGPLFLLASCSASKDVMSPLDASSAQTSDSGGLVVTPHPNGGDATVIGAGPGGGDGGASLGGSDANVEQPATCVEAAQVASYVGCEFWPTQVSNPVWSVFDFAAVVANTGAAPAVVNVDRGGATVATTTVAPGGIGIVYLPWVKELKGGDFDSCTGGARPTASVFVKGGAYHLTSSVPVTVWQFSPLEYMADAGGPAGKVWQCPYAPASCNGNGIDCLSVNNGASLLLPTAAMTGNYRLFGKSSTTSSGGASMASDNDAPGAFAFTATKDGTHVNVRVAAGARVMPGQGIPSATDAGVLSLTMNTGDVALLLAAPGAAPNAPDSDLSGSVATSDQPIQVIAFSAITDVPSPLVAGGGWADHLEETVVPAESLGSHYVVAPPTAPSGSTSYGHYVRFFGNRDGTTLSYPSGSPPQGAPSSLHADEVFDLPALVTTAFEVQGSNEFEVASIMPGGQIQDPGSNDPQGDPSLTFEVAVEQWRHTYVFLAPSDYAESFADVLVPKGANVTLDGTTLSGVTATIGASYNVVRTRLTAGTGGSHTIQSDKPVGVQIMGFGHATSYYTPGGYNLSHIAPPPPPVVPQ